MDFTGMFVASDGSAIGAIKALHDVRVALPGQIRLVGFDDIPMARYDHPSLTTIRQYHDTMAAAAIDLLEHQLSGDTTPGTQHMIAPSLIVRESTAAVYVSLRW